MNIDARSAHRSYPSTPSGYLKAFSRKASLAAIAIGVIVILGWAFDLAILKSVIPGLVTMKANTALGLMASGAALRLWHHSDRETPDRFSSFGSLALSLLVVLLGLLTLIQYGFDLDFGIDQLLFEEVPDAVDAAARGRMAPNTALNFLFVGSALVLLGQRAYFPAQGLAAIAFLVAYLGLLGHAYAIPLFYSVGSYTGMAIHTAISFILLALGILGASPNWGGMATVTSNLAGGIVARRLLPWVLFVPPILGGVILWGYRRETYPSELGFAFRSILGVAIFGALVWWNARRLNALDAQRQQFQRALLESERRFHAIFDQTFQFTGLLAPDGTLLEVNQTALDFGGLRREDAIGKPFWQVRWWTLSPQTQEQLQEAVARARTGEFIRYEVDVRGAGDTVATIDFSLKPVTDAAGRVTLLIPEGRDISDLKQVEAQLRESEERFRRAFEDAATGEALVATDGCFLRVNRSLCELLGYSESELLATSFQAITHPNDLEIDLGYVQQMLAGEIRTYQMEKRYLHKGDRIIWALLSVSLVRDAQNRPLYFVSQIQDITQFKQAQAQTKALVAQLESSNRELEEFAFVVSHDLLAPLNKIQMLEDLLQEEYGEILGESGREYLERMGQVKRRMDTLIKDLLALSRVTTQAQPFVLVDMNAIAQEVLSDLEAQIEQTGAAVTVGELPTLEADPLQMRQLLQNLLENALKFHQPEEPPKVTIAQKGLPASPLCQIIVKDRGIGFEEEYGEQIFEAFQRLHSRRRYPGTGLGLTICDKIVKRHQGSVTASSILGQGATFIVTLPLRQVHRA
jgi:PAS domain S-box-containing protein